MLPCVARSVRLCGAARRLLIAVVVMSTSATAEDYVMRQNELGQAQCDEVTEVMPTTYEGCLAAATVSVRRACAERGERTFLDGHGVETVVGREPLGWARFASA